LIDRFDNKKKRPRNDQKIDNDYTAPCFFASARLVAVTAFDNGRK